MGKKQYRDKLAAHQQDFLENELTEHELDHTHLVLKLHRRHHHKRSLQQVKPGDKPLKHMLLTANGITECSAFSDDKTLLQQLLPKHLREEEEEEEEGGAS